MTRRVSSVRCLALVLLVAWPVAAQTRHAVPSQHRPEFEGLPDTGTVDIPLEVVNNHLLIPISVNGSEPFKVILDTGMPINSLMLFGTERVEALKLEYGPMRARVGGAGGSGQHFEASMANGVTLGLAGMRMKHANVMVLPPMHGFHSYHDGIFGAALFNNFVVEINYDDSVVRLHDPEAYQPAEEAGELKLDLRTGYPYADIRVTTIDGTTLDANVVVDLGASHPLSLNTDSEDGIVVPEGAIRTVIGKGLSGLLHGQVGRVASVKVGGLALPNVIATFPDSEHQNPGGLDSRNGNLGNGLLRRFNVTFDYAHERMLLEPGRRFTEPFEHDMSGMWLDDDGEGHIQVRELVPGSPAEQAGLEADDVLTHVDGQPVTHADLFQIKERLREEGAEITVAVMRGSDTVEAKLKLRRLV
jgi:hypothetical protein